MKSIRGVLEPLFLILEPLFSSRDSKFTKMKTILGILEPLFSSRDSKFMKIKLF